MRNISLTQQYKQAVTDWNAKQQFTLFGTCQFMFKSNRTIEDRKKAVMRFWNAVARTIYTAKEIATEGKRVERIVYLEQGRSRDYVHFHFFCKANNPTQLKTLINTTQHFWNNKVEDTQTLDIKLNQNSDYRDGDGIKEYEAICFDDNRNFKTEILNEQIFVECCHLT